ncbi:ABC transporter permease [Vibrio sp. PP-XX7]
MNQALSPQLSGYLKKIRTLRRQIQRLSRHLFRHLFRYRTLSIGLFIVFSWIGVALPAPWIAPYDPVEQSLTAQLAPISWAHWLGTDNFGRDILSRMIWSARVDLQICLLGVIFPFMIGTVLGALSGYLGGWFDALMMRLIDVVLAFPFLVLMLAIITILGPGLSSFYIAMALVRLGLIRPSGQSPGTGAQTQRLHSRGKSLGYSHLRILFRHLLPNVIADAIVFSMSDAVLVLLNGAAISYLGLGFSPRP